MEGSHELNELELRALELITGEFPVTEAPYCALAEQLETSELDALNAVLALRNTFAVTRIGATFDDAKIGFCSMLGGEDEPGEIGGVELDCAEAELAALLQDDLPYGEHPYAELAAELQMRGIEASEEWVVKRILAWIEAEAITRFAADRG